MLKHWTGWLCVGLYAVMVVLTYIDYLRNKGNWFADLGLQILALPYELFMRLVTLNFSYYYVGIMNPFELCVGFLFTAVLLYFIGALVGSGGRSVFQTLRSILGGHN